MPRLLKIGAISLAALLALLVAALAIFAATFDPNSFKDSVARKVHDQTGRTLAIAGQVKLTFFPRLGVELGQASLSERAAATEFASVERAHVSLMLMPLLGRHLIVDRLDIDGLRARVTRNADGSLSTDDLVAAKSAPAEGGGGARALSFAIDHVRLANASVRFDDRKAARVVELNGLQLESGAVADKVASTVSLSGQLTVSQPQLATTLQLKTGFTPDLAAHQLTLQGFEAKAGGSLGAARSFQLGANGNAAFDLAHGQLGADKLVLTASTREGAQQIDATLALPSLKGNARVLTLAGVTLDASVRDGALEAKARLAGALKFDLDRQQLAGSGLALTLDGKAGGRVLAGRFDLGLDADLRKEAVTTTLKGKLDESNLELRLGLQHFAAPLLNVVLNADQLDLDRYRAKPAAGAPAAAGPASAGAAAPADTPVDLSALKKFNGSGSIRIGALHAGGLQLAGVAAELRGASGRLALAPIAAKLYGGTINGSLGVDFGATAATQQITLDSRLAGIHLGPLLKDLMQKDPVDGSGDVQLALTTRGASVAAMRRALGGSARIVLRDGSVRGFNLAQIVRDARAKLDALKGKAPSTGTSSGADKTDFTELSASLRIANGVAHNDDLNAKTPLFRIGGAGDIDLAREQLDYLVKCSVVTTLQGQGGPELQALKGLTVPVRLSGPMTALQWRVDLQAMVGDSVKQKVQEKVQDKLKDALKGLFGR